MLWRDALHNTNSSRSVLRPQARVLTGVWLTQERLPHVFNAGGFTLCVRARPAASAPAATTAATLPSLTTAPATPTVAASLSNVAALTAVATRDPLPPRTLRLQLELLHLQLLAWTTAKYEAALIDHPTMDTADTLSGTEASFEALLKRFAHSMDYVLQATESLPLAPLLRNAATTALGQVPAFLFLTAITLQAQVGTSCACSAIAVAKVGVACLS